MTTTQASLWSTFCALIGGAIIAYLLFAIPPTSGNGELDFPALLLFLVGYVTFLFGLGSLAALLLHRRWPALSGAGKRADLRASVALRQGILFAVGMLVLAILALFELLDPVFALVTFILIGLIEAFVQSRG